MKRPEAMPAGIVMGGTVAVDSMRPPTGSASMGGVAFTQPLMGASAMSAPLGAGGARAAACGAGGLRQKWL